MDWVGIRDQRDEAKAAALDAAIEYEDAILASEPTTDNEQPRTRSFMIDRQLLIDLDGAAATLKTAEDAFRDICRKIAAGGDEDSLVPAMGVAAGKDTPKDARPAGKGPGRGRAGWRAKVMNDPAARALPRPWKKIKCSICGGEMGSRRSDGVDYPVLHQDAKTGEACKGCFVPGLAVGD